MPIYPHMRHLIAIGALVLSVATGGAAIGQGKADSPSKVLGERTEDFARCVTSPGLVRLTLRLDLDRESRVQKVEIDSDASLTRGSRRCIEGVAMKLSFSPDFAGMTIEHGLQVVHGSGKRARR
jgi:hypothetical protein